MDITIPAQGKSLYLVYRIQLKNSVRKRMKRHALLQVTNEWLPRRKKGSQETPLFKTMAVHKQAIHQARDVLGNFHSQFLNILTPRQSGIINVQIAWDILKLSKYDQNMKVSG